MSSPSRFGFLLADTLRVLLEARRCGRPGRDHKKAGKERERCWEDPDLIVKGKNKNMHKKRVF